MQPLLFALKLVSSFPVREPDETYAREAPPYFPLAGMLVGLVPAVVGMVLLAVMPTVVAALVGAILLPILYSFLTRHHGFSGITQVLDAWFGSESEDRALMYRNVVMVQILVLIKFVLVGMILYYQRPLWLIAVPMLSHCAWSDLLQTDGAALGVPGAQHLRLSPHWLFAGVVSLVLGGFCGSLAAGLLAPILAWLAIHAGRMVLTEKLGAVRPEGVYALAEKLELLVLLVGILFFAAGG